MLYVGKDRSVLTANCVLRGLDLDYVLTKDLLLIFDKGKIKKTLFLILTSQYQ